MTPAAVVVLDTLTAQRRRAVEEVLTAMPAAARQELVRALTAFETAAARTLGDAAQRTA